MQDVDGTDARLVTDDGRTVALMDVSAVCVTAIVKSDDRVACDALREESAGSSAVISKLRRDETCRWVKRFASSAYSAEETGVLRDDSEDDGAMAVLAKRAREDSERRAQGTRLSRPWVDLSLRVGDRITGVEGRSLPFEAVGPDGPSHPSIGRISYDFEAEATEIDLRMPTRRGGPAGNP